MRCYTIKDSTVIVLLRSSDSAVDGDLIRSSKDFDQRRFPMSRLIEIWNALPGQAQVKRFQSRSIAVKRLWQSLESLPVSDSRSDSKQSKLISLISRPSGASIEELTSATGWQAHSVRGVLSGVLRKKLGLSIDCAKDGNTSVYRLAK